MAFFWVAVYSHNNQSEDDFVSGVRDILSSLGHARHSMPQDCVMNFSGPSRITRNCITLNLMLYQVSHWTLISLLET